MNLPNKLTLLRVILIPPIAALLAADSAVCRRIALGLFVIAALTDFLDGQIARRKGIVTTFGKFLDPVADKLLVLSVMIMLCGRGEFPAWLCVLVACRELAVDGLRLIAAEKGIVLAAGPTGKAKTVTQLVTLIFCLLGGKTLFPGAEIVYWVLIAAVALLTLLSGTEYFLRNRGLLSGGEKK